MNDKYCQAKYQFGNNSQLICHGVECGVIWACLLSNPELEKTLSNGDQLTCKLYKMMCFGVLFQQV